MHDFRKMLDVIASEIEKIEDRGLTTGNIETAYKLIDMYKDIKTIEGMEEYTEEYSERRGRRMYDRGSSYEEGPYMDYTKAKQNYRSDHSYAAKEGMMHDLEGYMEDMVEKVKEMKRDADTQEERDMIDRYINLIRK